MITNIILTHLTITSIGPSHLPGRMTKSESLKRLIREESDGSFKRRVKYIENAFTTGVAYRVDELKREEIVGKQEANMENEHAISHRLGRKIPEQVRFERLVRYNQPYFGPPGPLVRPFFLGPPCPPPPAWPGWGPHRPPPPRVGPDIRNSFYPPHPRGDRPNFPHGPRLHYYDQDYPLSDQNSWYF